MLATIPICLVDKIERDIFLHFVSISIFLSFKLAHTASIVTYG